MSVTTSQITVADEETGKLAVQTSKGDGIELKAVETEDGDTKNMIEGYVATTHLDQTQDKFTPEALENMAAKIREDSDATVNAVFPELEGMEESQIGNINHNNNPAAERLMGVGDTRIVPIFKTVHAETRVMTDGETGLYIRGEMLTLPDDLEESAKELIKQGALHSFSIEFTPTDVNFEVGPDGEPMRTILAANPSGAALTGRPMNENAQVTDAELKNILGGKTMTDNEGNTEPEDPEEELNEEVKGEDYEDEENKQEDDNPCEAGYVQRGMKPNPDGEGEVPNCIPEDEAKMEDEEENEDEEMKNDASEEPEEEEEVDETESESEEESDEEDASDSVELKNDVKELKSMFKDIKDENEKLKDENEELKSKLDDFKTIKEIKSEITQLKSAVEASDESLEGDRPEAEEDQSREVKSEHGEKEQWKTIVDQLNMDEEDLKREIGSRGMTEAESIAETHGVKAEEVIEYAK